jgi:hypothetical protein
MSGRLKSFGLMLALGVAAAVFWLLRDHWGHALGFAPYLLFLACPLMHLFMHHRHGRDPHDQLKGGRNEPPTQQGA